MNSKKIINRNYFTFSQCDGWDRRNVCQQHAGDERAKSHVQLLSPQGVPARRWRRACGGDWIVITVSTHTPSVEGADGTLLSRKRALYTHYSHYTHYLHTTHTTHTLDTYRTHTTHIMHTQCKTSRPKLIYHITASP